LFQSQSPQSIANERKSADWAEARAALIRQFPAVLAIVSDTWFFASQDVRPRTPVGDSGSLCALILQLLSPIANSQPKVLITSAALVWPSRGRPAGKKESDQVCLHRDYYLLTNF
jgi:hypothetical protein